MYLVGLHIYFRFVFLKNYIYTGDICIYIHIHTYIHIYIHTVWTFVQRNVATLDSVILKHFSEIIYAVMYSCRSFIGQ